MDSSQNKHKTNLNYFFFKQFIFFGRKKTQRKMEWSKTCLGLLISQRALLSVQLGAHAMKAERPCASVTWPGH